MIFQIILRQLYFLKYSDLWASLSVPDVSSDDIIVVFLNRVGNVSRQPYRSG